MKRVFAIIGIVTLGICLAFFIFKISGGWIWKKSASIVSEELLVPTEVYRPPIIHLPFTKYKTPVPAEVLPIPIDQVEKSITIKLPGPNFSKATLIVDKKGRIFKTTDTPEGVEIKVITWKQPVIQIKPRFGYSLVYSDKLYHCFSLDLLRVGQFYIGSEIGMSPSDIKISEALVGLSVKYHLADIQIMNLDLQAVAGWNFVGDKVYGGISMKW